MAIGLNTFASAEYYEDQYQTIQKVEMYEVVEKEDGTQNETFRPAVLYELVERTNFPNGTWCSSDSFVDSG